MIVGPTVGSLERGNGLVQAATAMLGTELAADPLNTSLGSLVTGVEF
jgi:hypothetical protein